MIAGPGLNAHTPILGTPLDGDGGFMCIHRGSAATGRLTMQGRKRGGSARSEVSEQTGRHGEWRVTVDLGLNKVLYWQGEGGQSAQHGGRWAGDMRCYFLVPFQAVDHGSQAFHHRRCVRSLSSPFDWLQLHCLLKMLVISFNMSSFMASVLEYSNSGV